MIGLAQIRSRLAEQRRLIDDALAKLDQAEQAARIALDGAGDRMAVSPHPLRAPGDDAPPEGVRVPAGAVARPGEPVPAPAATGHKPGTPAGDPTKTARYRSLAVSAPAYIDRWRNGEFPSVYAAHQAARRDGAISRATAGRRRHAKPAPRSKAGPGSHSAPDGAAAGGSTPVTARDLSGRYSEAEREAIETALAEGKVTRVENGAWPDSARPEVNKPMHHRTKGGTRPDCARERSLALE